VTNVPTADTRPGENLRAGTTSGRDDVGGAAQWARPIPWRCERCPDSAGCSRRSVRSQHWPESSPMAVVAERRRSADHPVPLRSHPPLSWCRRRLARLQSSRQARELLRPGRRWPAARGWAGSGSGMGWATGDGRPLTAPLSVIWKVQACWSC